MRGKIPQIEGEVLHNIIAVSTTNDLKKSNLTYDEQAKCVGRKQRLQGGRKQSKEPAC